METEANEQTIKERLPKWWLIVWPILTALMLAVYWSWLTAPAYTENLQFEIQSGMSVSDIADAAAKAGLVRSPFLLYAVLTLKYDPTNIHAGRYLFSEPKSVFSVAYYLASNRTELDLTTVTFPEGITVTEMATIAGNTLPSITTEDYLAAATTEGYLFPETYFLPPTITAAELVALQEDTLDKTLTKLYAEVATTTLSTKDLLTIASIVEREANDEDSMRMVAGIFINRLEIGMPLQADATIEYVLEQKIADLPPGELAKNLRETDSPYNTYLYPGLPPTPIGNPGAMALSAVLQPTKSDYFYYLTDEEGNFHYARTLSEHNTNVQQYLR